MRPYHHGNLRAALIETGVELARSEGPDGVVLREVARRTGVSHNAAYRHFADRSELLGEIAAVAADDLEEHMRRRLDAFEEPDSARRARRRLREVGRAYVEFALAEPGLFAVAFSSEQPTADAEPNSESATQTATEQTPTEPTPTEPTHELAGVGPYQLLGRCLDDLVEVGAMPPERREGADLGCWAAVHGFSVLCQSGPLHGLPPEQREAALDRLLDVVDRGLTDP